VAIYIFTLVPEFLMRFVSWIMIKLLYRMTSAAWRRCRTRARR
jgi:hypothetical protein